MSKKQLTFLLFLNCIQFVYRMPNCKLFFIVYSTQQLSSNDATICQAQDLNA